jgi:hypothetical protein
MMLVWIARLSRMNSAGVGVVGVDAADLGGGQEDVVRLFGREEGFHGGLAGEVEFGVGAGDDSL